MRQRDTVLNNHDGGVGQSRAHRIVSLADQVYDELLDAIVEHRLLPGTRLIPGTLSQELGVSVTPVKLALTRLIADGLVTGRSRHGIFVSQLDLRQLESLFEARLFLEIGAARDYFHRVNPEFVAALDKTAQEYQRLAVAEEDHVRRRLGDLDREFHRLIVHLTENEHIIRWYEQANVHIQGHRAVMLRERYEASIREHCAIVEAFRSADRNQAVESLRAHLANAKAHLILMLKMAVTPTPRLRAIRVKDESDSTVPTS